MVVAGIDGCRKGWLAVILGDEIWTEVFPLDDFGALERICSISELVFIDIPIGLPEKGERGCDVEARRVLGRRRASVFPVPCRDAVYAESYEKAVEINMMASGRKVSRQLWNMAPRIRAIDIFLRENPRAKGVLRESHPEICFASISGGPMEHSKRGDAGINERLDVIERVLPEGRDIYHDALERFRRSEVARDDILDALIMAVSAGLAVKYGVKSIPENPERDARGLEMGMFYGTLPS